MHHRYFLGKTPAPASSTTPANNQNQVSKPTLTAKSEVSQSTAISDRPKAKPNPRKKIQQKQQQLQQLLQQQQQAQQQLQQQSENAVSIASVERELADALNDLNGLQASQIQQPSSTNSSAITTEAKTSSSNNATNLQTKSDDANNKVEATQQDVPQSVPEASSTSGDKDPKATENCSTTRACSLIDLETFQKMRFNNLSNRSAQWDPKVFRKIAQIIDPPKSPVETPPESSQSSRPISPNVKGNLSE